MITTYLPQKVDDRFVIDKHGAVVVCDKCPCACPGEPAIYHRFLYIGALPSWVPSEYVTEEAKYVYSTLADCVADTGTKSLKTLRGQKDAFAWLDGGEYVNYTAIVADIDNIPEKTAVKDLNTNKFYKVTGGILVEISIATEFYVFISAGTYTGDMTSSNFTFIGNADVILTGDINAPYSHFKNLTINRSPSGDEYVRAIGTFCDCIMVLDTLSISPSYAITTMQLDECYDCDITCITADGTTGYNDGTAGGISIVGKRNDIVATTGSGVNGGHGGSFTSDSASTAIITTGDGGAPITSYVNGGNGGGINIDIMQYSSSIDLTSGVGGVGRHGGSGYRGGDGGDITINMNRTLEGYGRTTLTLNITTGDGGAGANCTASNIIGGNGGHGGRFTYYIENDDYYDQTSEDVFNYNIGSGGEGGHGGDLVVGDFDRLYGGDGGNGGSIMNSTSSTIDSIRDNSVGGIGGAGGEGVSGTKYGSGGGDGGHGGFNCFNIGGAGGVGGQGGKGWYVYPDGDLFYGFSGNSGDGGDGVIGGGGGSGYDGAGYHSRGGDGGHGYDGVGGDGGKGGDSIAPDSSYGYGGHGGHGGGAEGGFDGGDGGDGGDAEAMEYPGGSPMPDSGSWGGDGGDGECPNGLGGAGGAATGTALLYPGTDGADC